MSYMIAIKTAIIVFPIVAFLFTLIYILYEYHKYGSISKFRTLIVYSFILYIITIYFLVILPLPKLDEVVKRNDMIRLVPFSFIKDFIYKSSFDLFDSSTYLKALKEPCFYTVFFNILMTVPYGMYLRYYFKCSLKKTILFSFLLSLFFEVTQLTGLYFIYKYPYRIFDVDDLIINTLGGMLGYFVMGIFARFLPSRDKIDDDSRMVGRKVSGLRRVCVFLLDFLILGIAILFFKNHYIKLLIFSFYYIWYPLITGGMTLGSRFLNVKVEFLNYTVIRCIFRVIFIYMYYFFVPFFILYIANFLNINILQFIMIFFIPLFYFVNVIIILVKGSIFYDYFLGTIYKSTINDKK